MIRVLIADDHAVVRRGVKEIIADEFAGASVGEARESAEVLRLIREQQWDVVVLDISMPGGSGLDVLKAVKQCRPRLPVLVLSMHPEDQFAIRALRAGAAGYLTKESAAAELAGAIRKVFQGGRYVGASLAEKLAASLEAGAEKPPLERLSDREYEVLRRIASGKTVSEIAEELSLSVKTISTYRARILEKMHFKTNAELTRYAVEHGLGG